jgi:hypothetical protein
MQWRGPYTVVAKMAENVYRISIVAKMAENDYRISLVTKTYHINMLQKYIERSNGGMKVASSVIDEDLANEVEMEYVTDMFCPLKQTETWKDVKINPVLREEQKESAEILVKRYQDRLTDLPGCTNILEREIELDENIPFRSRTYPLPFAVRDTIKNEVEMIKQMGIIEPSSSQYISPPVIVKKPDSTNRFCIDFRRLNAVTKFDAGPIPNREALMARMGESI